jgi:opacity protein-like surface antigen
MAAAIASCREAPLIKKEPIARKIWEFFGIGSINVTVNLSFLDSDGFKEASSMTRFFLLLLIALICAPAAFAQGKDYSYYEFYVGYAYERADNNADRFDKGGQATFNGNRVDFADRRNNYNGFNAEFNQNVTRHIGIVTSFTGTYNSTGFVDTQSGRAFNARVQRYDLMIGPRYNWRLTGVTPFVHAMAGITHMRASFDDVLTPRKKADTAFAMALGGGLDVHAGEHIDVRAIQVDYLPTFFNGSRQDNLRVGAGIKIK